MKIISRCCPEKKEPFLFPFIQLIFMDKKEEWLLEDGMWSRGRHSTLVEY
jgi:hypothetical protein